MAEPQFQLSPQMEAALESEHSRRTPSNDITKKTLRWTPRMRMAAMLYAEGKSRNAILAETGISPATYGRWTSHPEFMRQVAVNSKKINTELARTSIANRVRRLERLQRRSEALDKIVEERGKSTEMQEVAGGKTGFIVRDVKAVGQGRDRTLVEVYSVDTALLKEMRELEKQAAIETGQWVEKMDPLTDDAEKAYGHSFTIEDRRTFIVQIFAELGITVPQQDLEGTADALGRSLPAPGTAPS